LGVLALIISEFLPSILIKFKLSRVGYNIFGFFNQRFLIELFYNKYITGIVLKLGGQTTKIVDKGTVELLGPFGLEKGLLTLSRSIANLDTGVVTSYALYILVGLIFYISIPLYIFDNTLLILILLGLLSLVKGGKSRGILSTKYKVIKSKIYNSYIIILLLFFVSHTNFMQCIYLFIFIMRLLLLGDGVELADLQLIYYE
jgi:NADH-ubiquinone oxidoreductase chain 5